MFLATAVLDRVMIGRDVVTDCGPRANASRVGPPQRPGGADETTIFSLVP